MRERGAGRPHAVELRMFQGKALNILMRGFKGRGESDLWIAAKSMVVDATDGLNGQAAGLLSAFVSPHAVGDDG